MDQQLFAPAVSRGTVYPEIHVFKFVEIMLKLQVKAAMMEIR